jgi:hypothetical protein
MTTMIVLNIVISLIGIAVVAGVMRFGYGIGGGAFDRPRLAVVEVETAPAELERAA